MSAINVNSITGRTGTHGPVLTGITTATNGIHVTGGSGLDLTGSLGIITATTYKVGAAVTISSGGVEVVGVTTTQTLKVGTAGTTLNTTASGDVTTLGRFGVGTTPDELLHIRSASDPTIRIDNTGGTARQGYITVTDAGDMEFRARSNNSDGQFIFYGYGGITDDEQVRIDSPGRLLVGTSSALDTSAGRQLQVADANGAFLLLGRDDTTVGDGPNLGGIHFYGNDTTSNAWTKLGAIDCSSDGVHGAGDNPTKLVFSTTADSESSPTERMRINRLGGLKAAANGAAYVSVSSPLESHELTTDASGWPALYVVNRNSSSPEGVQIYHTTDKNNTGSNFLNCYGSATLRAAIRSNGGLANYQSNNVDLSDERTKRDISSVSSTWDCVQAWDVVNYNYLEDTANDTARIGVIAQQVQQHCPEVVVPYQEAEDAVLDDDGNVVTPAKEERLGVREQQMMWMAIKALQEAQTRIETLETQNADLLTRVSALEG